MGWIVFYGGNRKQNVLFWVHNDPAFGKGSRCFATKADAACKAALATLELPRIEGTIKVKMVSDRRVLRPKATLDTPEYSASVWLSRDALHQHAEDILAAFEDVREDDLTTEFKAALLNAGTLAVIHVLIRVPLSVQSCFALQVLQQRGVLQLLLARLLP